MGTSVSGIALEERVIQLHQAPRAARPAMAARIREQADALGEQLNKQHEWLFAYPDHARYHEFEERWLADLHRYEAAYDAINRVVEQKEFSS